jgi:hypothetical protein
MHKLWNEYLGNSIYLAIDSSKQANAQPIELCRMIIFKDLLQKKQTNEHVVEPYSVFGRNDSIIPQYRYTHCHLMLQVSCLAEKREEWKN